ncbi:MAG: alpha/beta fold hydrolase [Ahrensia sp.]|nr:alpha/beta fold hydrolase [Ahrensia sp.]
MAETSKRDTEATRRDIAADASESTLALNPLVAPRGQDMMKAYNSMVRAAITQPDQLARQWLRFAGEMGNIFTMRSQVEPDPKDRRFADPAWKDNPVNKALMQSYLAWAETVTESVNGLKLGDKDAARARLMTSMFVDAMAPSNALLTNPTAMKTLFETGGQSAVEGLKNFFHDMTKNGGLPSSVDDSKFKVGENLANTLGKVVFRNEVIEVIHYTPTTDKVWQRPFVIVPPQINKYYAVDLSEGKSMVRFLLESGMQPFCISWRNPTAKHRDWTLQTYIEALDEAIDAICDLSGCDSVSMMGSCSGGITLASYAGWLAAQEKDDKIEALVFAVCVLDTMASTDNDMAALVTPQTVMAAKQASKLRGVLDGQDMAKMFAWMRPNDLIWNYWVNNYLLGNQPPAFDVLYWNADTTRLPAGLHGDFLDLIFTNPFLKAGALSIGGHAIDMRKVKKPAYVIGGTTDHITPWKAVYETARIFGEDTTFVLSNSGHLQSLLNPPGNPKAWYVKGAAKADDADAWVETGERQTGSWWLDWVEFLKSNSGKEIKAPKEQGNKKFPILGDAPGTYVFEE